MEKEIRFKRQTETLGIHLSESQYQKLNDYYELLIEWNKVMNLTAITEYTEVYEKHFLDSLAIVKVIDLTKVETVIDIGTGAGFPGIPLKIAFPHLNITLLDSLNKRINFLNEVKKSLRLENVETIHGRAEDFAKEKKYREYFDLGVSRAVADLSVLSEYCLPYIKVGGKFIPYKSDKIEDEAQQANKAVEILGGKIKNTEKLVLPETEIGRSFVIIEKIKLTPNKYPRKAGTALKKPIH